MIASIPGDINTLGYQGYSDWVSSLEGEPDNGRSIARQYAETYGYSANQMANFWNETNPDNTITGKEAAGNLGINSEDAWKPSGNYWNTQNPTTGAHTQAYSSTDPQNYSNWSPATGSYEDAASKHSMTDEQFYTGINNMLIKEGNETGSEVLKTWMNKYGYTAADIAGWYNAGSGGAYNLSPQEVSANLGIPNTVSIPGMVDNHSTMNAQIPGYFNELMTPGIQNFNNAYDRLAGLPEEIDAWTVEALKRQRVTGDMATEAFNSVANQRAGSGIQGGTEAENLEANAVAKLSQIILENQNNIQASANNLKAGTIQNTPGVAAIPISSALSLYGTSANEAANWGNMAMNTLLSGY